MKHRTLAGAALTLSLMLSLRATTAHAQAQPAAGELLFIDNQALAQGERADAEGRAQRDRPVPLQAGETLDLAMTASFDAVIRVAGPDGFALMNDDAPGEGTNARLQFTAPVAGVYVVTATTYAPGEAGWYSLVANRSSATALVPPSAPNAWAQPSYTVPTTAGSGERGRVFGLFVGVTNYGENDITRGAEDAEELATLFVRRGVMQRENAVVLTNAQASGASIGYTLSQLSTRMTPRDSLVFYFGGHGGVNSMAMPSGSMTAAELSESLDRVPGRQLVALDSCHSGSFEWVVQRSPRRAGLFSSTAAETSYTASSVNASGWLVYFLMRAAEGQVPAGSDNAVQLSELAGFVQSGYRAHAAPQTLVVRAGDGAGNLTLW
jgi:hypothetical protein